LRPEAGIFLPKPLDNPNQLRYIYTMKTEKEIIAAYFSKMGKKGGKATTDAKRTASRENGKKGGRPRKVKK